MKLKVFSFETGRRYAKLTWWLASQRVVMQNSSRWDCRKSANPVCYHRKATNKPLLGGFFVPKIRLVSPLHHA
ncbi:hypothetical protein VB296_02380 [Enterobacter cloacae]|uniref:hypothetical protein n=1 Tax=Enterobacter cloacae TaxID=550 RepID=UPI001249E8E9|nr:hypothetical protein [Enterobacter cloacae]MCU6300377.1 hypothetical protein [Enterobacter cloacae]MEA5221728.1 hypothetical protein [Enterobacter cloacae]